MTQFMDNYICEKNNRVFNMKCTLANVLSYSFWFAEVKIGTVRGNSCSVPLGRLGRSSREFVRCKRFVSALVSVAPLCFVFFFNFGSFSRKSLSFMQDVCEVVFFVLFAMFREGFYISVVGTCFYMSRMSIFASYGYFYHFLSFFLALLWFSSGFS